MITSLEEFSARRRSAYKNLRGDPRVVLHAPPQPWRQYRGKGVTIWQAGTIAQADRIADCVERLNSARLLDLLRAERGQFGMIVESDTHLVAAVDRVTGFPIFLRKSGRTSEIAADSSIWLTPETRDEIDAEQAQLFLMAGYCLGRDTLLKSVARLLPGEAVIIRKSSGVVERLRYYRYEPSFAGKESAAHWRQRLDEALNASIDRFLDQNSGRRIWLGLSAGYDSRLLLGKLLQHGARDLQTFSYGTPGNMEARIARDLAASVGVPWRFVATPGRANRRDFREGDCAAYRLRGGGVSAIAAVTEYFALQYLIGKGHVDGDDVVTNGQTGDFLSGGHIPKSTAFNHQAVDQYILQKHLSLFRDLADEMGSEGARDLMDRWRGANLSGARAETETAVASAYQTFEWQERQARLVVNQHRAHDFLGLKWQTPLWDSDLMDVFHEVPLRLQQHQSLYLSFLKAWNYRGLFEQMRLPYDPWPRGGWLIKAMARGVGLLRGEAAKQAAYERFAYFGEYHYLYRLTGRAAFRAFALSALIRSPASLFALDHLIRVRRALARAPEGEHERTYAGLMGWQDAAA